MTQKAKESKVLFRPHFKTHQSAEIGEWFREAGVTKISVSSVTMAEYFANAGWKDILIAFPVNILEIERINTLAPKIILSLLLESEDNLNFLADNLTSNVNISLKIDTGYHRTGIAWDEIRRIQSLIPLINKSSKLNFTGFVVHSGHTYNAKNRTDIIQIYKDTVKKLSYLKNKFTVGGFNPLLSVGDTPSCSIVDKFNEVDEIRPGNFVFYDVMQSNLGSCFVRDISVALACPVVAVHPDRYEAVIYGGAIHLSKEFITDSNGNKVFGLVVKLTEVDWTEPLTETFVKALSQEHGIISTTDEILTGIKPGDVMGILPVHSCLTAHQMKHFWTLDGKQITTMNS
jgi:D-serine deaminase-like pyridoxal phosphate-dependent protein